MNDNNIPQVFADIFKAFGLMPETDDRKNKEEK